MEINNLNLKNNENNKKNYIKLDFNYGLAILKVYLAFLVEIIHNFNRNSSNNKIINIITRGLIHPVPSFFILSFYFMCSSLISINIKKFYSRLERLFIPYIFWPIIIWLINNLFNLKYNGKFINTFFALKYQLLYGHVYMAQFWFLWSLIVITLIFNIIISIFKRSFLFILQILLLISYLLQYSGFIYTNIFLKYPFHKQYTLSRIFGMLPLGITGFILGLYNVINIMKKNRIKFIIFCIIIFKLINNYNVFVNQQTNLYFGIKLNIDACCVIFIFSLFPLDQIENKYIKKFLILITNHSAGIFYLHVSIKHYFMLFFDDIKKGTLLGIILNYLLCYLICFFGIKFFGKTRFKYLFS